MNVLDIKCFRSLVGVSQIYQVGNKEVHWRAGIERELASRTDQFILRWFGHVEMATVLSKYRWNEVNAN